MVDRIKISNNDTIVCTDNLGYNYNSTGLKKKYRLYRTDNPQDDDSFITVILNSYGRGFVIDGNLRKWWFGTKTAVKDFDYYSFCSCIKAIAKLLKIKKMELWNSHISYLEIGGNIKLQRKYEFIIPSMVSFPRLQRATYKNETTTFPGTKIKISAYDKTKEVLRHLKKNVRERICKGVFVMRFEIRLQSPGYIEDIDGKVDSLYKIKNNWNALVDYWSKSYMKIEFSRIQNPKVITTAGNLSRRELKDFGLVKAVELLGINFFENVIDLGFLRQKRSWEKKHLRLLCKKYWDADTGQYIHHVKTCLQLKAQRMKKRHKL